MADLSAPPPPNREALRRLLAERPGVELAELARRLKSRRPAPSPRKPLPPIERIPRGGPLPATFYQQWAWRLLSGPVSAELNMPFAHRYSGALSVPALQTAFLELERRQEALRTRLVPREDDPESVCQIVDPPGRIELPLIDLSGLPEHSREGEIWRITAEDADLPIDLAAGPIFRARLVRLGEQDHAMLLNLHHLVGDGWSVGVLSTELAVLYDAFSQGLSSPLPELPVQFADYAAWQWRIQDSETLAAQVDFWRERLAGLPSPAIVGGDSPAGPALTSEVHKSRILIPAEAAAEIRALAVANGATPAMVLLTAWKLLLVLYTGETDLVVGSKVVGRTRPEVNRMIGLFMNTLLHRTDLSGQPGFAEALRRVRVGMVEDYCNQDLPYPRLIGQLFPERRASRLWPTRVSFNMLTTPPPAPVGFGRKGGFSQRGLAHSYEHAKYDLIITVLEEHARFHLTVTAAACRFHADSVTEIARDLEALILRAAQAPDATTAELLPHPCYRHAPRAVPISP